MKVKSGVVTSGVAQLSRASHSSDLRGKFGKVSQAEHSKDGPVRVRLGASPRVKAGLSKSGAVRQVGAVQVCAT